MFAKYIYIFYRVVQPAMVKYFKQELVFKAWKFWKDIPHFTPCHLFSFKQVYMPLNPKGKENRIGSQNPP